MPLLQLLRRSASNADNCSDHSYPSWQFCFFMLYKYCSAVLYLPLFKMAAASLSFSASIGNGSKPLALALAHHHSTRAVIDFLAVVVCVSRITSSRADPSSNKPSTRRVRLRLDLCFKSKRHGVFLTSSNKDERRWCCTETNFCRGAERARQNHGHDQYRAHHRTLYARNWCSGHAQSRC